MSVSPNTGITVLDNFLGAAAAADGTRGQVPTPVIGDQTKFLRGDGTWATPPTSSSGGADLSTQPYAIVGTSTSLTGYRSIAGVANQITASDGGALGSLNFGLASIVPSNTVGSSSRVPVISFDTYGRITSATDAATSTSGGSGVDLSTQAFVIIGTSTSLTGYRSITNGFGLAAADSGAAGSLTLSIASTIIAGGPVGTASTVPVITYSSGGQLTAVTTAAITPTAIGAVPTTRTLTASTGLTGGGDLSADRSFALTSQIVAAGPIGSASVVPIITFNLQGQLTTVTSAPITAAGIGAVPTTRNIFASGALSGGGDLSADRTISLASIIAAAGPIGTASTVPVITYDAWGRLTAVTTAAITPTSIGAVPTTRQLFASGALTGGGDLSADRTFTLASIITATNVGSSTLVPVLTIDAYGRISFATTAAITAGSTVNASNATVDFGFANGDEGDIATVTVTATWVLASSNIICVPYAVANADHDPEDYAVEGITAYAANLASGVGFDIIAMAPNNTWGRYSINAHGV